MNNLYEQSKKENREFVCHVCKAKPLIKNNDIRNIETNASIIQLIEVRNSKPWVHFRAACPCCKQIESLEKCFECFQPVCNQCQIIHYNRWNEECDKSLNTLESRLRGYIGNIGIYF